MKISVSVMAHPDRAHLVDELLDSLDVRAKVAFDTGGKPSRDPERIWQNAKKAWGMHDGDADWHVVLQDDAIVAKNLMQCLPSALGRVPDMGMVSLYVGDGRPMSSLWGRLADAARACEASWIVGPRSMWGVGLAIPVRLIGGMVEYCSRLRGIPDDMRIGRWGRRAGVETWFTWPSLVDHPQGGSLVGHGGGRVARSFAFDAHDWNWDGAIIRSKR